MDGKIIASKLALNAEDENAQSLTNDLMWLSEIISIRFQLYFKQECPYSSIFDLTPPDLTDDDSVYAKIVKHYNMAVEERIVLLITMAPHFVPQLLDAFFLKNGLYDRVYSEFGGVKGRFHSGFLPTGETAMFVLAANDLSLRIKWAKMFDDDHYFSGYNILSIERGKGNEPLLSGPLSISEEYLSYFSNGQKFKPAFSSKFPAKRISTPLEWGDLVLEEYTLDELKEINAWLKHGNTLMEKWGLNTKLKPGFRTLFYGPPGTGKTLSATLLGKSSHRDVYRVDLSQIISKYIGETEKNLASIFNQAENKDWILFFDEADALFGRRSMTTDAKDRYANQEIAYLLQRIEDFNGLIILATNLKSNLDEAFARRFQSMIYFPMPNAEQRFRLWQNAFLPPLQLDEKVDLSSIAEKYEISGGGIINVLRSCALKAIDRQPPLIFQRDILQGIRKEFQKEGKTF